MNVFVFKQTDSVLFLGEGNFSFTCGLIKKLKALGFQHFSNFYSTCFENEEVSSITLENRHFLESEGVRVIFGVDATKLSEYDVLHSHQFQKVLFNFPHVGGKMKIHLNRLLLKNFFISVSNGNILSENGEVFVSLCAGQGGTAAEAKQRRWDDTWQVTEMAAYGDFLLKRIEQFPHVLFPNYVSTGFRSTVKSFHTEGSLVHVFQKSTEAFPDELEEKAIKNLGKFHFVNGIEVTLEYKNALLKNPLNRPNSPQSFLLSIMLECCKEVDSNSNSTDLPLYTKENMNKSRPTCIVDSKQLYLRKSLYEVLPEKHRDDKIISAGLIFNEVTDLISPPAECEIIFVNTRFDDILNMIKCVIDKKWKSIDIDLYVTHHNEQSYSLNLDKICLVLCNTTWKELWSDFSYFIPETATFIPPSVFPRQFEFDVSFSSNINFDLKTICTLLIRLPGRLISSVRLLSIFCPEDLPLTYYCYRITYISSDFPIYRSRVVAYHSQTVCNALRFFLKVTIH